MLSIIGLLGMLQLNLLEIILIEAGAWAILTAIHYRLLRL
jgi:hypothetical protein